MANQIQCPKCKGYNTEPYSGDDPTSLQHDSEAILRALGLGKGFTFENVKYSKKFMAGEIRAQCKNPSCGLIFNVKTRLGSEPNTPPAPNQKLTTAERLSELEQLRPNGLLVMRNISVNAKKFFVICEWCCSLLYGAFIFLWLMSVRSADWKKFRHFPINIAASTYADFLSQLDS